MAAYYSGILTGEARASGLREAVQRQRKALDRMRAHEFPPRPRRARRGRRIVRQQPVLQSPGVFSPFISSGHFVSEPKKEKIKFKLVKKG